MAQPANPNDATGTIKLAVIAVAALILVIFGSCQMVKCACGTGGKAQYQYKCAKQGCKGEKFSDSKKAAEI